MSTPGGGNTSRQLRNGQTTQGIREDDLFGHNADTAGTKRTNIGHGYAGTTNIAAGDPKNRHAATMCGLVLTAVLIENVVDLLLDSLTVVLTLGTALNLVNPGSVDKGVTRYVFSSHLNSLIDLLER